MVTVILSASLSWIAQSRPANMVPLLSTVRFNDEVPSIASSVVVPVAWIVLVFVVVVIVTPSSPSASTAVSEPVRVISARQIDDNLIWVN